MKIYFNILFLSISISISVLHAASLELMIGKVEDESNSTKMIEINKKNIDYKSLISTCDCSDSIQFAKSKMKSAIEEYINNNISSLDKLNNQLDKNYIELKNRTNNIIDSSYFDKLKKRISFIFPIQQIKKHKLLGYENVTLLSKNGIIDKEEKLKNVMQIIKNLESIENSIIIKRGN